MPEFQVTVTDTEECRDIEHITDPTRPGHVVDLRPWPGSDRYFLKIRLPSGALIRAQLTKEDFDTVLALPEFAEEAQATA
jgi:hypothetical protein